MGTIVGVAHILIQGCLMFVERLGTENGNSPISLVMNHLAPEG